ncbi:MAG: hypothetical protein CK427_07770 [Leptospira sp.]|nr:MAG: hypothetical protein CK427_07770 [Leptospira sp.]
MKLKSILKNTIAIGAIVSIAVNCKPDKVEENALLGILVSRTISNLASGNCAISVNGAGIAYGALLQIAISFDVGGNPLNAVGVTGTTWLAHYNSVNSLSLTFAELRTQPYNKKFDTFYTDKDTWNDSARAAYIHNVRNNATVNGALAGNFNSIGAAVLACARVPRTQCSLVGTTTSSRAVDVASQISTYNSIQNNDSCKKTDQINNALLLNLFRGDDTGTTHVLAGGTHVNPTTNNATASVTTTTSILAERAYPKFGSLVSLGFGSLMPLREKVQREYAITATEYVAGSNIGYRSVESCEAIGLPGKGIVSTGTTPISTTVEISYALSANGIAAAAYNTAAGNPSAAYQATAAGEDAKICNNSYRALSPISAAIGGGRLPASSGGAGDGGQSVLLTTCVYGANVATRNTFRTTYNATALNGITDCPATAVAGATIFKDAGLDALSNFPNN